MFTVRYVSDQIATTQKMRVEVLSFAIDTAKGRPMPQFFIFCLTFPLEGLAIAL
jgi:hypothetical protein